MSEPPAPPPGPPSDRRPPLRGLELQKWLAHCARVERLTDDTQTHSQQLEAHDGRLDEVTGRVEYIAQQTGALAETIENLAQERREVKPKPIWWPGHPGDDDQDDRAQQWDDFTLWLATVLAARYPHNTAAALTPCWANHPTAVDALTSLWLTWKSAYLDETADTALAADWHTTRRPALLAVTQAELAACDDTTCRGTEPISDTLLASFQPTHDQ